MKKASLTHTHEELDNAIKLATNVIDSGPNEWTIDGIAAGLEPNGEVVVKTTVPSPGGWNNGPFEAYTGISSIIIDIPSGVPLGGDGAFAGMSGLKSVYIKQAGNASLLPRQWFMYNGALERVVWAKDCSANPGSWFFDGASKLKFIDFGNCTSMGHDPGCSPETIIIRRTDRIVPPSNFRSYAENGTGCTIYVPESLIASYKVDTNWAVYDAYGTITWKAIEGSEYE